MSEIKIVFFISLQWKRKKELCETEVKYGVFSFVLLKVSNLRFAIQTLLFFKKKKSDVLDFVALEGLVSKTQLLLFYGRRRQLVQSINLWKFNI